MHCKTTKEAQRSLAGQQGRDELCQFVQGFSHETHIIGVTSRRCLAASHDFSSSQDRNATLSTIGYGDVVFYMAK